jgi:4-hydroxybenzoate polyprenyltransferase
MPSAIKISEKSLFEKSLLKKKQGPIFVFLEMIKFEHTLFALPFAYTGALLASRGALSFSKFCWITLAMASARTAGMSLNRVIDAKLDALNPRTAQRALPRGLIQQKVVWGVVVASLLLLVLSAGMLNSLCLKLAPVAVFLLLVYSYLKRFTWLCHLGLGFLQASAPIGGWLAVTGSFSAIPFVLGAAMIFWMAGLDILYACQDFDFDRTFGVYSIPAKFGIEKSLWISAFCHLLTFAFLAWLGVLAHLGKIYTLGLVLIAVLLVYEHAIVTPRDLSRINQAFFHANVGISLLLFLSVSGGLWR